jgi:hypothetical protein
METLPLDSLDIRHFRMFERLRIERLKRVNLIAGGNNVGKTCLLEALWLYARRGEPGVVWQILGSHDEVGHTVAIGPTVAERTHGIKHLFYGRPDIEHTTQPVQIGAIDVPETRLEVGVGWYVVHETEEGRSLEPMAPGEAVDNLHPTLRLKVQMGKQIPTSFLFSADLFRGTPSMVAECIDCVHILSDVPNMTRIAAQWDAIAGSDKEQIVLDALRFIVPDIESFGIPSALEDRLNPAHAARVPCVQLAGSDVPVPVRSLGHGVTRLLSIVLALLTARSGFLLIDNIEDGLHHTVQAALWGLILRTARQADVQVFATAHTWDCIRAFQQAAEEEQDEGLLVCLRQQDGDIEVRLFEGEELLTVPREQIECTRGL